MSNKPLTKKPEWAALNKHHAKLSKQRIGDLFAEDAQRFSNFSEQLDGLLFDYSKTLVTTETMDHLTALAKACGVEEWRDKMFAGEKVNTTENRAVLHMALRGSTAQDLEIDGENVAGFAAQSLELIKTVSTRIRTEKTFTDVVNIGIGGSDLGPHMVCDALKPFADGPRVHFVSNIDGAHLAQALQDLDPKTTLFIIASKTFTTLETLTNAESAKDWMRNALGEANTANHFMAITENEDGAKAFGIKAENILPLREWIGGRYSLWSTIGVTIAIQTGYEKFEQLLAGAHSMDRHFESAPLAENIPVIMAMIGVWHRNFCGYGAQAILPYAQNLHKFPGYLQQIDMESSGKSVDLDGKPVTYETGPVIFGEPGTDNQHAFFQLLHQGTGVVPCDFIMALQPEHDLDHHHIALLANAVAQSEALMSGNGAPENAHQKFEGNRPACSIVLNRLDPYHLGMLLALYEHKIFVQGVIWTINSFDQWGVELGKNLAREIIQAFDNKEKIDKIPSGSKPLLDYILRHRR